MKKRTKKLLIRFAPCGPAKVQGANRQPLPVIASAAKQSIFLQTNRKAERPRRARRINWQTNLQRAQETISLRTTLLLFLVLASCATPHPQYGVGTSLSCVPYAREVSGIQLSGDAWQWWDEAAGLYPRAHTPSLGAVIVFAPHGSMTQGHLAVVTALDGARAIRVTQANWLPDRIESDQPVIDVSPYNDWSEVRVWYEPIQAIGATTYPVYGFILPR